uniref:Uncharacterized protein n=1 Tax=Arundo donax TaxID=35708 RepID=A0A0A9BHE7_ARUDO
MCCRGRCNTYFTVHWKVPWDCS